MNDDTLELPAYSPPPESPTINAALSPREPVTHTCSLTNRQGKDWARLKVISKARSAESVPLILEGEPICGSVELDLATDTPMKSVMIHVSLLLWP